LGIRPEEQSLISHSRIDLGAKFGGQVEGIGDGDVCKVVGGLAGPFKEIIEDIFILSH
jgi:hypothetical protein